MSIYCFYSMSLLSKPSNDSLVLDAQVAALRARASPSIKRALATDATHVHLPTRLERPRAIMAHSSTMKMTTRRAYPLPAVVMAGCAGETYAAVVEPLSGLGKSAASCLAIGANLRSRKRERRVLDWDFTVHFHANHTPGISMVFRVIIFSAL